MTRYYFLATILYLLFVIYGSLVPLAFHAMPFVVAREKFQHIPYLHLGAGSRADWLANILLYIPLAFFASATANAVRQGLVRALLVVFVFICCVSLAIAIEFMQLYFPPRTVSLNDLIAETIGTAIGILAWQYWGMYFINLYQQLTGGNWLSVKAAIVFYLLIYGIQSLLPFDFVTSFAELNTKLANSQDAIFMSLDTCQDDKLRCGLKLLVEMLMVVPLGFLFCYFPYISHRITTTVLVGFFLGVFIESMQVFLLSGKGQGISVITRMLGMAIGANLFMWSNQKRFSELLALIRPLCLLAILPYVLLVLLANDWFTGDWITQQEAAKKLAETHFLPLYYFYFASETVAIVSLLNNLLTYLPIGLLFWGITNKIHWFFVGSCAAVFAVFVETGKLFSSSKHADPTGVLIAFMAAAACYVFMNRLSSWLAQHKRVPAAVRLGHE